MAPQLKFLTVLLKWRVLVLQEEGEALAEKEGEHQGEQEEEGTHWEGEG